MAEAETESYNEFSYFRVGSCWVGGNDVESIMPELNFRQGVLVSDDDKL